jgi:hypothetical protein
MHLDYHCTLFLVYNTPLYHNIDYLKDDPKLHRITKDYLKSLHDLENKLKLNILEPNKLQVSTGI